MVNFDYTIAAEDDYIYEVSFPRNYLETFLADPHKFFKNKRLQRKVGLAPRFTMVFTKRQGVRKVMNSETHVYPDYAVVVSGIKGEGLMIVEISEQRPPDEVLPKLPGSFNPEVLVRQNSRGTPTGTFHVETGTREGAAYLQMLATVDPAELARLMGILPQRLQVRCKSGSSPSCYETSGRVRPAKFSVAPGATVYSQGLYSGLCTCFQGRVQMLNDEAGQTPASFEITAVGTKASERNCGQSKKHRKR
jgi:hypothetical protein